MTAVPIAFLFLGAVAPFYAAAAIWDRREKYTRLRRSRRAERPHRTSPETNESGCRVRPVPTRGEL